MTKRSFILMDPFITEDEYLEYLEDLTEECEEEEEADEEANETPAANDLDDLVSEADLAAMAEDEDDDEPSSEGETPGEAEAGAEDGAESAGEKPEGNGQDPEATAEGEAEAEQPARRSTGVTLESVEAGFAEINTLLSDIDARRDKLEADWDDGEIEDRETFKEQLRALRAEEREASRRESVLDRQKARIEDEQDQIQATWEADVHDFLAANPDYTDPDLQDVLRKRIGELGQDQTWLDKGNPALLAEAMRLVDTKLKRVTVAAPAPKAKDELSSRRDVMKGRGKRPSNVPNTLGGLPAAEAAPIQNDEFTAIDNLPGDKREDAIARMTPDKRQQYLNQA